MHGCLRSITPKLLQYHMYQIYDSIYHCSVLLAINQSSLLCYLNVESGRLGHSLAEVERIRLRVESGQLLLGDDAAIQLLELPVGLVSGVVWRKSESKSR